MQRPEQTQPEQLVSSLVGLRVYPAPAQQSTLLVHNHASSTFSYFTALLYDVTMQEAVNHHKQAYLPSDRQFTCPKRHCSNFTK